MAADSLTIDPVLWGVLFLFPFVPSTQVPQGEVIQARAKGAATARMNGRAIRLFPQTDGTALGLMPVPTREEPGPYKLEFLDRSGAVIRTQQIAVVDAHYARQNIVLGKETAELKPAPGESEAVGAFQKAVSDTRYWAEPLLVPVPGCMTSPFGVQRYQNGKATGNFHAGLDQRGASGTPIHAVTGGTVKIARMFNVRGGTVAIDHGQGLGSIYMHMSKIAAKEGERVQAGDVIGYVGATGRVTAAHLHWSLYANGIPVNPSQWVHVASCYEVPRRRTTKKKASP